MKVTVASYIAEYLGAFFFILSFFASGGNPFVIGGALALVIFIIAGISGGYVNPAVSFAMFMNSQLNVNELSLYIVVQLLGGLSAYYAYRIAKQ
jgi:aquaporin Z